MINMLHVLFANCDTEEARRSSQLDTFTALKVNATSSIDPVKANAAASDVIKVNVRSL